MPGCPPKQQQQQHLPHPSSTTACTHLSLFQEESVPDGQGDMGGQNANKQRHEPVEGEKQRQQDGVGESATVVEQNARVPNNS